MMDRLDRLLTGWFHFTFPTRLTTGWPGMFNDMMKAAFMPTIVDAIYTEQPMIKHLRQMMGDR